MEHKTPGFTSGAKRTHWQAAVAQQELSGLSAAAFCREQGLSYQSFISWRKRLATEGRRLGLQPRMGPKSAEDSTAVNIRQDQRERDGASSGQAALRLVETLRRATDDGKAAGDVAQLTLTTKGWTS